MKKDHEQIEKITSLKNPRIKNCIALQKGRERRKQGLFVVEGRKELIRALQSGFVADHLFFCPDIIPKDTVEEITRMAGQHPSILNLTETVYNHIAYRNNAEGIIGWFRARDTDLANITLSANPLILVIQSVEKPGNLGAILRTADAAGIDAVVICDPLTDMYNPNVIRSSLGGVFSVQVASALSEDVIDWLKERNIHIFCTALDASFPYTEVDYSTPTAIVMGTESTGLSNLWLDASDRNIIIPMKGKVDSMNVSVSTAIVLFEAVRQRSK